MSLPTGYRIEPLGDHDRKSFSCGEETLDQYLHTQVGQDRKRDLARCYVLMQGDNPKRILGYYTLSTASIVREEVPEGARLPYTEIPCLLLGRLARDLSTRGQGIGDVMMAHILRETERIADEVGVHALIVDALNEQAATYYTNWGFTPLAGDRLYATVKSIRATLRELEKPAKADKQQPPQRSRPFSR